MNDNFGVIESLNDKGFGFIKVPNLAKNIFFHASAVKGLHFNDLKKGDEVVFDDPVSNDKGFATNSVSLK